MIETEKFPQEIGVAMMEEIELLRTLDSPYIVGYIDSFIGADLSINIILEYCHEGDLQTYFYKKVAENKASSFHNNFIWKLFIQICLGIQYLHTQKGILHRDIKMLNIFLTKDKDAKIGDFGAAQRIQDSLPIKLSKKQNDAENTYLESIIEETKEEGGLYEDTLLFSLSASNTLKRDYKNRKVGTPFYLAPELWLSETNNSCSKQSDMWSLGVILYELCT
jgi:serine/threonine protein kinase